MAIFMTIFLKKTSSKHLLTLQSNRGLHFFLSLNHACQFIFYSVNSNKEKKCTYTRVKSYLGLRLSFFCSFEMVKKL